MDRHETPFLLMFVVSNIKKDKKSETFRSKTTLMLEPFKITLKPEAGKSGSGLKVIPVCLG